MRIYIESTVPSYLVARPSRDQLQLRRQQLTLEWWETDRKNHDLLISQLVLDEIASGEPTKARQRTEKLDGIPIVAATEEVDAIFGLIAASGALPSKATADASHIALATAAEVDILLSWNYRHLANGAIQASLRKVVSKGGFTLPVICTPEQLLGEL